MCAAFAKTVEVSTLGTAVAITIFQIYRAHRAKALVPMEKSMKLAGDSPQLAGSASQYRDTARSQAGAYAIGPVPTLVPQPSNFHCTNRFRSEPAPIVLKTPRNRRWLKRRDTKRSVQPEPIHVPADPRALIIDALQDFLDACFANAAHDQSTFGNRSLAM